MLNLNNPQIILDAYLKVCKITGMVLIFIWILFGPIADYLNLKFTGYMVGQDVERYHRLIKMTVDNGLTNYPRLPDFTAKYILLPSWDFIFNMFDFIKDYLNNLEYWLPIYGKSKV